MAMRKIFETTVNRFFTIIVSSVVMLVGAQSLGPAGQGAVAVLISWAVVISQLVGLSLPHIISFHLQKFKNRTDAIVLIADRLLRWAVYQSVFGICIFCVALNLWGAAAVKALPMSSVVLASLLVPGFLLDEYLRQISANAGSLDYYNRASFLGRSVVLLVCFLIYAFDIQKITYFIALNVFLQLITTLFFLPQIRAWISQARRLSTVISVEPRMLLANGLKLFPNTLGSCLLLNNGVMVAGYYLPSHEIGWFQMGLQIASLMSLASQSTASVIYAKLSMSTPNGVWLEQRRYIQYIIVGVCISVAISWVAGPVLIPLVLGQRWGDGALQITIMTPVAVSMAMAQLMAPQWIGRGFLTLTAVLTVSAAILCLLFNLWLVPRYGLAGLIAGYLIFFGAFTFACQLVFYFYCNRQVRAGLT